jgi:hypothetical protein
MKATHNAITASVSNNTMVLVSLMVRIRARLRAALCKHNGDAQDRDFWDRKCKPGRPTPSGYLPACRRPARSCSRWVLVLMTPI